MNSVKDVVKLLVPYPDSGSVLDQVPHMYICIATNGEAQFLKCQSFKPYHKRPNSQPSKRIVVDTDTYTNPFKRRTIVDLEKIFTGQAPTVYAVIGKISDELLEELLANFDSETAEKIILA